MATIEYSFSMQHPFEYMLMALHRIFVSAEGPLATAEESTVHEVGWIAWTLCRHSFRTTLCLYHDPRAIAIACIYIACEKMSIAFPQSCEPDTHWYNHFCPTLTQSTLLQISRKILQSSDVPPPTSGALASVERHLEPAEVTCLADVAPSLSPAYTSVGPGAANEVSEQISPPETGTESHQQVAHSQPHSFQRNIHQQPPQDTNEDAPPVQLYREPQRTSDSDNYSQQPQVQFLPPHVIRQQGIAHPPLQQLRNGHPPQYKSREIRPYYPPIHTGIPNVQPVPHMATAPGTYPLPKNVPNIRPAYHQNFGNGKGVASHYAQPVQRATHTQNHVVPTNSDARARDRDRNRQRDQERDRDRDRRKRSRPEDESDRSWVDRGSRVAYSGRDYQRRDRQR